MTPNRVLRIARVALNVADLKAACAFYTQALNFRLISRPSAKVALLELGRQRLELRACAGRPYPQPRAANDPWFQHFAVAVSDMAKAYRHLSRYPHETISRSGPQLLPPSTGSVTAYKFRDPEGHPLELSYIPGSAWLKQAAPGQGPFLGIDHSALAVSDLECSTAFYRDILGLAPGPVGVNQGPEQDRLDGLDQTQVQIAPFSAPGGGMHIELLHYRSPRSAAQPPVDPQDVAATRLLWEVGPTGRPDGQRIQDPDGHGFEIVG